MQENLHESVYNYGVSIQDKWLQFKGLLSSSDFVLSAIIVVVSLTSFYLGKVSVSEQIPLQSLEAQAARPQNENLQQNIQGINPATSSTSPLSKNATGKGYVASKSGTKYHLPWCGSAKQIKEENKIWFATKEEAEKAGYTPASNCKGI